MAFVEDHSAFFQNDGFAVEAGYVAAGSVADPVLVQGIFDNGYDAALGGLVDGAAPLFLCALADVPGVTQGAELEIDGVVWTVADVRPDGTGQVRLILQGST